MEEDDSSTRGEALLVDRRKSSCTLGRFESKPIPSLGLLLGPELEMNSVIALYWLAMIDVASEDRQRNAVWKGCALKRSNLIKVPAVVARWRIARSRNPGVVVTH